MHEFFFFFPFVYLGSFIVNAFQVSMCQLETSPCVGTVSGVEPSLHEREKLLSGVELSLHEGKSCPQVLN